MEANIYKSCSRCGKGNVPVTRDSSKCEVCQYESVGPLLGDVVKADTRINTISEIVSMLIDSLPAQLDERVQALNTVRSKLHEASPFKLEPVDLVLWVPANQVSANDYNPNAVAPPEMQLLAHSIQEDGFTQPIVTWAENGNREVIDGFHRNLVGKEDEKVLARIKGYLPVTTANDVRTERGDRIASTIRHNRARGKHRVDSMSEIVVELKRRNWSDKKIGKELGMEPDEVLRLAQISGLAEMFADKEFSEAWEAEDSTEYEGHEISEEEIIEDEE